MFTHLDDADVAFRPGRYDELVIHHVSLYRNTVTGLTHLVAVDPTGNQFRSVAPDDITVSGPRCADRTDTGIALVSSGYPDATVEEWKLNSLYSVLLSVDSLFDSYGHTSTFALAALIHVQLSPYPSRRPYRVYAAMSVEARIRHGSTMGAAIYATNLYRGAAGDPRLADTRIGALLNVAAATDETGLAAWCNHPDRWIRREAVANPACPDYARAVVLLRDPDVFLPAAGGSSAKRGVVPV